MGKLYFLRFTFLILCCTVLSGIYHHAFAQGCSGVTGTGVSGGAISTNLGYSCANIDQAQGGLGDPAAGAVIRIDASSVVDGDIVSFEVNWDDGTAPQAIAATKTGANTWAATNISHFFPVSGATVKCLYTPRITLIVNGAVCTTNFGTPPEFIRWNKDNENTGILELSETASGANTFLVCEGVSTTVTFTDRSTLNCVPPALIPLVSNRFQRWRRFTYGTSIFISGPNNFEVGGVPVLPGVPLTGGVSASPDPVFDSGFPVGTTQSITVPATARAGDFFEITMDYWNTCNPYPAEIPVATTARILVVSQPPAPTAVNSSVCTGTNPLPDFRINIPGSRSRVNWYADNAGSPGAPLTNPNGNNSRNFPASAFPGGIDNTVPGIYHVWAGYVGVANVQNVSCESPLVQVELEIIDNGVSVGPNQTQCAVLTSDPLGGSPPGAGSGEWTVFIKPNAAATVTFSPDEFTPGATATVSVQGAYVFRWTVTNSICQSSADIRVDFGNNPGTVEAGNPTAFCGFDGALNATPPLIGMGTWTLLPGAPGTANIIDVNDAKSLVSVSAPGDYVFQWEVTSTSPIACFAPIQDQVTLTFRNLPTVVNITPTICDAIQGLPLEGTAQLTDYNDAVSNGAAATSTITWYEDSPPPAGVSLGTSPLPENGIITGKVYVARVQDNTTLCTNDATVTFTIQALPPVMDNATTVCEDLPGSSEATNVDLTDAQFINAVLDGYSNVTVNWFPSQVDAVNITNEITPPITVNNTRDVWARVTDNAGAGCVSIARLTIVVSPVPAPTPIIGSESVCVGASELYQIPQVTGAQYYWDIPTGAGEFEIILGGGVNDFFVFLRFPNVFDGTIKVRTELNNCGSAEVTKDISVSPTPTPFAINGPAVVCENEIGVNYAVVPDNTGTSSYNWEITPASAGLVSNGQTTGDVLINFLTDDVVITVTESNASNCFGPPQQLAVTINQRPIMLDPSTDICSDSNTGITFTADPASPVAPTGYNITNISPQAGLTYPGTNSPIGNNLLPDAILNDVYENLKAVPLNSKYTVTPVTLENGITCPGPTKIITVNVKPEPQLDPGLNKALCSDEPTLITLVSAPNTFPADKFIVESITRNGLTSSTGEPPLGVQLDNDAILNNQWVNTTINNVQVAYSIRPYSTILGCAGNPPTDVLVTVYPTPVVNPVAVKTICSSQSTNVSLTANIAGVSFLRTVKSINGNITGATSGVGATINDILVNEDLVQGSVVYEVQARNGSSQGECLGPIVEVQIFIDPAPVTANITDIKCSNVPGGTTFTENLINLQPIINNEAGVTYTWYTNQADPVGSAIPVGNLAAYPLSNNVPVYVSVRFTATGCAKVATVRYTVNPGVDLVATATDYNGYGLKCNNDFSGSISVVGSFGTLPYSYSIDNGPFFPVSTFDFLQAGSHTVVIQDAKGCFKPATLVLNEPAKLDGTLTLVEPVKCFLDKNAIIETTATGGTELLPYTYTLLQNPANVTGQTTGIFSNVGAGTYTVRIRDANDCFVDTTPLPVDQPTQISLTASVVEDANGYQLSCNNATDGVINVTATGGNGADYTYSLKRSGDPLDPFATLTGGGAESFTNLPFGNYIVSVVDNQACPTLPTIAVIVNPPPFEAGFIGVSEAICLGEDPGVIDELVPPFGGIGNYQYQWQQSLTGSANDADWSDIVGEVGTTYTPPAGLGLTTYYRRLVRSGSCDEKGKDNHVKVTVNPLPVVTFNGQSEVCQGESFFLYVNLLTGTAPIEYDYTDGTNTFAGLIGTATTIIPITNFQESTTFELLRVKDLNGCEIVPAVPPVTVEVIKIDPEFTVLAPTAQCPGGEFNFQWTVEPNVKYTWLWADNSQDVIDPNTLPLGETIIQHVFAIGSPVTSTIYPVRLQAENTLCIPKITSEPVTVYPFVSLNINAGDTTLCSGETIEFKNQSQGVDFSHWYYRELGSNDKLDERATDGVTYTLENLTTQNPIVYEVVYEGSNSEGCSDTLRQQVVVYRQSTAAFTTGPIDPFTGGVSTVVYTNASDPLDSDFEYTWDFGDNHSAPPTATGAGPFSVDYFQAGNKNVILRAINIDARDNANKICQTSFYQTITIPLPNVDALFKATPLASCFPVDITVENLSPGADTFEWEVYGPAGLVTTSNLREPVFKINKPGTYDIFLTASFFGSGQVAFAEQKGIEVFDRPQAAFDLRPTTVFVPDTEMRTFNFTTHATDYAWTFGETNEVFTDHEPIYIYKYPGNYTVTLVAAYDNGIFDVDGDGPLLEQSIVCYDTATQDVFARQGGVTKLPNAFTPNPNGPNGGVPDDTGGSFNDVFLPITRGVEEFEMQIFDRWGNMVFVSHDKNIGWDGYDKGGRLLPAGVYVFKLILRLSDQQRTTQIGDVTLIR